MPESVLERFLRYVQIDTQSSEQSETSPSTPGQWDLLRMLAAECEALGLAEVQLSEHGYLTATIAATAGCDDVPVFGLIAHVDTSPEMSGAGVRPIVHRAYDGRDLPLPDDPAIVLRRRDIPLLDEQIGHDVVTASGLTLLGADNKAGVAEIMAAAQFLQAHPAVPHGRVRIAFTPDEEIGRGTRHFDLDAFGAVAAYTMDGGRRGELAFESFSADALTVVFQGRNTHPGYAKGKMVNAIKLAAAFIVRLPADTLAPEVTDGFDGYVHPYLIDARVDRTSVKLLLRDFREEGLRLQQALLEGLAREVVASTEGASVSFDLQTQYRNMRTVCDAHPAVIARATEAIRRTGLVARPRAIRGGTDGSALSLKGLPTPNLFAGEQNFHSRYEWVSVFDMEKAVEMIVHLAQVWQE